MISFSNFFKWTPLDLFDDLQLYFLRRIFAALSLLFYLSFNICIFKENPSLD